MGDVGAVAALFPIGAHFPDFLKPRPGFSIGALADQVFCFNIFTNGTGT